MSRLDLHDLQPFVDRLAAHSVLGSEEQQAVLALPFAVVHLRANHDFVRINEKTSHVSFIASGLAARFGQTRDGARQITAFHIPGDIADLGSAVGPAGVCGRTALCDTTVLRIPNTAIRAVASLYPAVAEAFWRDCMLDAAILMQWALNVGRQPAKTRLAHIFCEMAIRMGGDCEVLREYTFPVTQDRLADATGLSGMHVNRSLKALEAEGLMTASRGRIYILDWARLADVGEFEAAYLLAGSGS
jgi:CRP-like cAMP-binding protein